MSIEGQGHFFTIYFPGFVCFVLYLAKISGERLQDHWSSGFIIFFSSKVYKHIYLHRLSHRHSLKYHIPVNSINFYVIFFTPYMYMYSKPKTAITLAPPTVARQSADLSANKMPDFSSFFIGRQKINYNYLVIIFFHRPTVLGFWQSADVIFE